MKVLLLSPLPPPAGGIATWTQLFIDSEEAKKSEVDVVNTAVSGKRIANYTEKNLKEELKRFRNIYKEFNNKIDLKQYDIVHVNCSCSMLGMIRDYIFVFVAKLKNIKVVVHFHCDTSNMIKDTLSRLFFKKICKRSDKIFCLNTISREHIMKIAAKESIIIPNFVNETLVVQNKKILNEVKTIIFVGHILKTKGCAEILAIAKELPSIQFKMAGYLSEEIKNIPISKNINYLGEISKEEVINQMLKADLFLLPTHTEGFPYVLLEAMACGLPIISTPVGAIPDMLEKQGGEIVKVGDVTALISAIEKLQNNEIRKKMSIWNREKVLTSYISKIVTKKVFDEYLNI